MTVTGPGTMAVHGARYGDYTGPPPPSWDWVLLFGQSNVRANAGPWTGPEQQGAHRVGLMARSVFGDPHGPEVGMLVDTSRGVVSAAYSGQDFDSLFPLRWSTVVTQLSSMGITPRAVGFIHGEADSADARADAYRSKLDSHLLASVDAEYGPIPVALPLLKTTSAGHPRVSTVIAAQRDFAASHGRVTAIETEDLTFYDDRHYDSASLGTLGARIAAAVVAAGAWS